MRPDFQKYLEFWRFFKFQFVFLNIKNPNISRSKLEKSREFQVFLKIWPHSCLLILVDISEARFSKILGILAIFQVSICFFEYKKSEHFKIETRKIPRIPSIFENLTSLMSTMGAAVLGARKSIKTWWFKRVPFSKGFLKKRLFFAFFAMIYMKFCDKSTFLKKEMKMFLKRCAHARGK